MSSNPYESATPPAYSGAASDSHHRRMRIRKVEPLALGKLMGGIYFVLGAFLAVFFLLAAIIGMASSGGMGAAFGGVITALLMPFFYGLVGFIGGVISAFLYNIFAGMFGGMEMEVEVY